MARNTTNPANTTDPADAANDTAPAPAADAPPPPAGTGWDPLATSQPYRREVPRGADGPPPSHAESLGALPHMPEEVKREYARTGRTPLDHPSVRGKLNDPAAADPITRLGLPEGAEQDAVRLGEATNRAIRDANAAADRDARGRQPQAGQ